MDEDFSSLALKPMTVQNIPKHEYFGLGIPKKSKNLFGISQEYYAVPVIIDGKKSLRYIDKALLSMFHDTDEKDQVYGDCRVNIRKYMESYVKPTLYHIQNFRYKCFFADIFKYNLYYSVMYPNSSYYTMTDFVCLTSNKLEKYKRRTYGTIIALGLTHRYGSDSPFPLLDHWMCKSILDMVFLE